MKKKLEELIYFSASENNIVSLGSACNMRCVFCSHQFNGPELEVYQHPFLTLEEVSDLICFLAAEEKIVIGESVTRIVEGEPFLHPAIFTILEMIRAQFPQTEIQLTTNVSLLTEVKIKRLMSVQPLSLNVSLNSASIAGRRILMYDKQPEIALQAVKLLGCYGVPFHGSIVAMPQVVGWDDLGQTIDYLAVCGAQTIRVFLPGFSDYHLPDWHFGKELRRDLLLFLETMRQKVAVPLLFEPPELTDLQVRVSGVLIGSPAEKCEIRHRDLILEIAGKKPRTRVEAYQWLKKFANPGLKIERNGNQCSRTLLKAADETSGVIFDYDLETDVLDLWSRKARKYRSGKILLCASRLALPILTAAVSLLEEEWEVLCVSNRYLGGSLCCAGLLLVEDYVTALADYLIEHEKPEVIFVSNRSFDRWGRDLKGMSYRRIAETYEIFIELI